MVHLLVALLAGNLSQRRCSHHVGRYALSRRDIHVFCASDLLNVPVRRVVHAEAASVCRYSLFDYLLFLLWLDLMLVQTLLRCAVLLYFLGFNSSCGHLALLLNGLPIRLLRGLLYILSGVLFGCLSDDQLFRIIWLVTRKFLLGAHLRQAAVLVAVRRVQIFLIVQQDTARHANAVLAYLFQVCSCRVVRLCYSYLLRRLNFLFVE